MAKLTYFEITAQHNIYFTKKKGTLLYTYTYIFIHTYNYNFAVVSHASENLSYNLKEI
jgi:hypothetical protein